MPVLCSAMLCLPGLAVSAGIVSGSAVLLPVSAAILPPELSHSELIPLSRNFPDMSTAIAATTTDTSTTLPSLPQGNAEASFVGGLYEAFKSRGENMLTPDGAAATLRGVESGGIAGLGANLAQSVIDAGLQRIEQQAGQHLFRNLNLNWAPGFNGREDLYQIDAMLSLYDGERSSLMTQLGLQSRDGEAGANAGLVLRTQSIEHWILGLNAFYDYLSDPDVSRWSAGAELKGRWLGLSGNIYIGLDEDIRGRETLYSPDGWDVELSGHVPDLPWLEYSGRYYKWDGESSPDLEGQDYKLTLRPVPLFDISLRYDNAKDSDSGFGVETQLSYEFGRPMSEQLSYQHVASPASAWSRRFERVRREYEQRVQRRSGGATTSVTRVTASGTGVVVQIANIPAGTTQVVVTGGIRTGNSLTRATSASNAPAVRVHGGNCHIPSISTASCTFNATTSEITIANLQPGNYNFGVSFQNAAGTDLGGQVQFTVTIAGPTASIAVNNAAIAEAGGVATVTVTLDPAPASATVVNLTRTGTGTVVSDYTVATLAGTDPTYTLMVAANTATATFTVTAVDDSADDDDETAVFTIASVTGYTVASGGAAAVTVTITDDDGTPTAPTASIYIGNAGTQTGTITEAAASTTTVTVRLSPAPTTATTVSLMQSGTATVTSDYTVASLSGTAPAYTLMVAANTATATFTVTAVDDSADDDAETAIFTVATGTGYTPASGSAAIATVTITDDDGTPTAPTASLSVTPAAIAEAGGVATVTVTLSSAPTTATTVNLTRTGSATIVSDYSVATLAGTDPAYTLTVAANTATATFTVTAVDDSADDDAETAIFTIATGTGYTPASGSAAVATVTITDDDADTTPPSPVTGIAATPGDAQVVLSWTNPAATDLAMVMISATAGGTAVDLNGGGTTGNDLSIAATASSTGTSTITSLTNGTEYTFSIVALDGTGNPSTAVTIMATPAMPPPEVSFRTATATVAEGSNAPVNIAFTGGAFTTDVTFSVSVGGSAVAADYTTIISLTGATPTIRINAGITSPSLFFIFTTSDTLTEGDETVIITLLDGDGYTVGSANTYTLTITDPPPPSASIAVNNAAIAEAGGVATVTVTLSSAPTTATTVNLTRTGSATIVSDYSVATLAGTDPAYTLTVAANTATATFTVTAVDDSADDDDETAVFTVATGTGYTPASGSAAVATVTITDDDADTTPPSPVTGIAATPGNGQVVLSWTNPAATDLAMVMISATAGGLTVDLNGGGTTGNDLSIAATASSTGTSTITSLTNGTEYTFSIVALDGTGNPSTAATIMATPAIPTPEFSFPTATATVAEGGTAGGLTSVVVNIAFTGGALTTAVNLSVSVDGTAVADDYTTRNGTANVDLTNGAIELRAGIPSPVFFVILPTADALTEDDETVIITLLDGDGYTVGSANTYTLTITDVAPPPPVASIYIGAVGTQTGTITEAGTGSTTVTVTLSSAPTTATTVSLTRTGSATVVSDYTVATLAGTDPAYTLTVPANTATATFMLTAVDDSADDDAETAVFTIATGTGYTPASGAAAVATVTITDDDADTTPPSPVTGIAATPGNGQVVLSWTNPTDTDLAMVMISATAGGTAVDLNGGGTTGNDLSIAATASSTGTSTITSLTNGTEYTFSIVALDGTGNPSTAVTIMATPAIPPPEFSFPTATATLAEGGSVNVNIAFTGGALATDVTLSVRVGGTAVAADYTTGNGSASADDLLETNGAIGIGGGRTSPVGFIIFPTSDTLTEGDETLTITLLTGNGYTVGSANTYTLTITDVTPQQFSFPTATATVAEGGARTVNIAFTGGALTTGVTLSVSVGGSAVAADYITRNSSANVTLGGATPTIRISAGRPSPVSFGIFTTADALTEGDETVTITLLDGDGYTVGSANTYTLTITNVAPVASIYIGATGTQVGTITEAGTSATTVTVELAAAAPAGGLPVNLMRSGDATIATDYSQSGLTPNTDPAYSIMIAEGATTATFMLTAVDDSADDDDETAVFTVATGTGYTPASGSAAVATVTITDDDADTTPPSPVTGIAATPGNGQVVLSWTNPAATDLAMVMISATAGGTAVDLNGGGTTGNDLSIAATASSTGTSTITSLTNGTEYTFSIVALDGTGNPSTAATIMATPAIPPPPEVSFPTATATLAEGGSVLVNIAFTGGALAALLRVSVSVSGTAVAADYTTSDSPDFADPANGSIRIIAGRTSPAFFAIFATRDTLTEDDETLIITLLDGDGYTVGSANTYTLTITDVAPPPVASIYIGVAGTQTGTITEAGTSATTVTVELAAAAPTGGVTVNLMRSGDATIATDYSQSGLTPNTDPAYTLTVPASMTTATFTVTAVDDAVDDDDETAVFTVVAGTGYTPASGSAAIATVTITDDDADTTPPSPVTGIAATPGDAQVVLSWTNPAATDLAMVMISATAGGTAVDLNGGGTTGNDLSIAATASSTGTSTITSLTNGTEYTFSIVALDGTGNPSTAATIMATPAPPPEVSFPTATATVAEGGSVVVNIAFTGGALTTVVDVSVSVSGTAVAADYRTANSSASATRLTRATPTIAILAGRPSPVSFSIFTTADTLTEGDETVLITLLDGDGYTVGSANTYTLTITNVAPVVSIYIGATGTQVGTITEAGTSATTVTVELAAAAPAGGLPVNLMRSGDATIATDYSQSGLTPNTDPAYSIMIAEGATTATFMLTAVDDSADDNAETAIFTIATGTGYTPASGAAAVATVTITDDDAPADTTPPSPVTGIAATPGNGQVVLSWTNPAATDLAMVMISATAGGTAVDLNGGGTTGNDLSIAATASSTGTSTITSLTNGTEYTFSIVALDGTGNPSTAVTIMATPAIPPPQFSFPTATATVAEGELRSVVIAFTGGALTTDVNLSVSVSGTAVAADYTTSDSSANARLTGATPTIRIIASFTSLSSLAIVTFIIRATTDTLTEGNETLTITLLDGDGYTVGSANTYTLTITEP